MTDKSKFYKTTALILIFVSLFLGLSIPSNFFNWVVCLLIVIALILFGIDAWTAKQKRKLITIIAVGILTLATTISYYLAGPFSGLYRYSKDLLLLIAIIYLVYIFYQTIKKDFQKDKERYQVLKNRKRK